MNLMKLVELINTALHGYPPPVLINMCQKYYEPYYFLMYLLAKEIEQGDIVELGVSKGNFILCPLCLFLILSMI
jgi:hypothetical protein